MKTTTFLLRLTASMQASLFCTNLAISAAPTGHLHQTGAAMTLLSPQPGSWFGSAMSAVGDVNGDGYTDLLVGAPQYRSDKVRGGAVFLFYGSSDGFTAPPAWMTYGTQPGEEYGHSVAFAGDVNGDGYDDLLVGAPNFSGNHTNEGKVCVFHGAATGPSLSPDWFATGNQPGAEFGRCVDRAGDLNADTYADIIVGAPFASAASGNVGRVAVYSGSRSGLSKAACWEAWGEQPGSRFGWSASTAGDINGDGNTDIIVGAPGFSEQKGRAYLFPGHQKMLSPNFQWFMEGRTPQSYFGIYVADAGDVNGDTYHDVLIGASHFSGEKKREGSLALYQGSATGLGKTAIWMRHGTQSRAALTHIGGPAGDINGDGYADILMTQPFLSTSSNRLDAGRVELYLGGKAGLGDYPEWSAEGSTNYAWLGINAIPLGRNRHTGSQGIILASANITNGFDCTSLTVRKNVITSTNPPEVAPPPLAQDNSGSPADSYEGAMALRMAEKLDAALMSFARIAPKFARDADAHLDYKHASRNYWWLARLQFRRGDLNAAIDSFAMAEQYRLKEFRYGNHNTRLVALIDTVSLMIDRRKCLMELGKAAAARHVLDEIIGLSDDMLSEATTTKHEELPQISVSLMIDIKCEVARQRLVAGELSEYEDSMKQLLSQAKSVQLKYGGNWFEENHATKSILDDLARFSYFTENYSAAIAYSEARIALPVRPQYAFEDHLAEIQHARYLATREGASGKALGMATVALEKLQTTRDTGFILKGRIILAELLTDSGRPAEALATLTDVITEAQAGKHHQTQADAQVARARCLLKLNHPTEAARDCLEALALRRALGLKHLEPEVFELYALALGASGHTALAIQTWNNAFDLCMSLNMPFRALHMLLGLAHLHLETGHSRESELVWQRIDTFLQQHPKMPPPTMARYRQAKESAQPGLPPANPSPIPAETVITADRATGIPVISPTLMLTQVKIDEYARARFFLFNTNTTTLTGSLVLSGVSSAHWVTSNRWWTADVNLGNPIDRTDRPISIPSGEARIIYLQSAPPRSNTQAKVSLQWNGAPHLTAEWIVEQTNTIRQSTIVNVSLDKTNPFFHSTFYHELYYRGTAAAVENIRIVSSLPCRVEFLSLRTGRIMAVDANGNGSFEDTGDVLDQDLDGDTCPDFYFDRRHPIETLELLVFPGAQDLGIADQIELNLYLKTEGSWQLQGTDILRLR